ncbi:hypothetical protein Brsp02_03069 [Brucella sp. NBRC 113783]
MISGSKLRTDSTFGVRFPKRIAKNGINSFHGRSAFPIITFVKHFWCHSCGSFTIREVTVNEGDSIFWTNINFLNSTIVKEGSSDKVSGCIDCATIKLTVIKPRERSYIDGHNLRILEDGSPNNLWKICYLCIIKDRPAKRFSTNGQRYFVCVLKRGQWGSACVWGKIIIAQIIEKQVQRFLAEVSSGRQSDMSQQPDSRPLLSFGAISEHFRGLGKLRCQIVGIGCDELLIYPAPLFNSFSNLGVGGIRLSSINQPSPCDGKKRRCCASKCNNCSSNRDSFTHLRRKYSVEDPKQKESCQHCGNTGTSDGERVPFSFVNLRKCWRRAPRLFASVVHNSPKPLHDTHLAEFYGPETGNLSYLGAAL